MRSTLALLLLFGAVIGLTAGTECTLYTVPQDKACTIDIKWKVHTNEQATATCLEYFPTTFVKGVKVDASTIRCTVEATYQCVPNPKGAYEGPFVMFDKCYYFPKDATGYVEGKMSDYESEDYCKGGKLSVFYSHTNAKFLGVKANTLGIDKLWIGITKEGKTIDGGPAKSTMMHAKLWKVVEGHYWDADDEGKNPVLKAIADPNDVANLPDYYFYRTRNDQFNNRFQGSFERASKNFKATFVCEFEAKPTTHQRWYCEKMQAMGFDAVYDHESDKNREKSRCLYISANSYAWKGTYDDMKNIKGCQESPSLLHSAGLDDGTGTERIYDNFIKTNLKGKKLRLAGHMTERTDASFKSLTSSEKIAIKKLSVQPKCTDPNPDDIKKGFIKIKWWHLDHHGKSQMAALSKLEWDGTYPRNECSDFPGMSTTLGLKDGKLIDMPTEVLAQAICSITFFQECESTNPCKGKNLECKNTKTFQINSKPELQGFFTCQCPGPEKSLSSTRSLIPKDPPYVSYVDNGEKSCKWNDQLKQYCAWFRFYDSGGEFSGHLFKNTHENFFNDSHISKVFNDKLDQVVVRDGCTVSVRGGVEDTEKGGIYSNPFLLIDAGFGTHEVPSGERGTLPRHLHPYSASYAECTCTSGI